MYMDLSAEVKDEMQYSFELHGENFGGLCSEHQPIKT